jgi:hypothetical protein
MVLDHDRQSHLSSIAVPNGAGTRVKKGIVVKASILGEIDDAF